MMEFWYKGKQIVWEFVTICDFWWDLTSTGRREADATNMLLGIALLHIMEILLSAFSCDHHIYWQN